MLQSKDTKQIAFVKHFREIKYHRLIYIDGYSIMEWNGIMRWIHADKRKNTELGAVV